MKNNNLEIPLSRLSFSLKSILFLVLCFFFTNVYAQNVIEGKIIDKDGLPIPGVNVIEVGTNNGTLTDFDGNFSITAPEGSVLTFSFIGMESQQVTVGPESNYNIIMSESAQSLEEMVIVGYGAQRKSDVISSVVSVKPQELVKVPTSDIGEMLRGKAAGVQVTLGDGGPGSSSNILIRGKRSINANNAPIVIADGVPVGNINDINPNDIASLEILKDAASQAIYGARASNGVILITTKRGILGKTTISYNGFSGIQTINRNFEIYNGEEFAQLKREAFRGANLGEYLPDDQVFSGLELESVLTGEYIDWEDELIRTGITQNHNLSISSGTETAQVYSSFNYLNEAGVIPNSDYEKATVRLNADQKVNKWLDIGINSSFQFSTENRPNVGSILINSLTTSPLGQIYNEDGSFRYLPGGFEENKNPLIDLYETNSLTQNRNDIINIFADISPFLGFNYRLNLSRRSYNGKLSSYDTAESIAGITNGRQGQGFLRYQDNVEWQLENILTYETIFLNELHSFDATLVQSINESKFNQFSNDAINLPNDILGIYGLESAQLNTPYISGNRRSLLSFAGRVQYDYANKYYIMATGRADASSVFGSENKWGYFPSVGVSWNAHNEEFLKEVNAINNLKFRVTYGSVGNEAIRPYESLSSALQRDYLIDGTKVSGYVPGDALPNPDLKWETTTTFNAAFDLGMFQNRLTTTVEFYNSRTTDLLINRALNAATGYSRKLSNLGEVENQGIEVDLNAALVRSEDLNINIGILFSKNENKILSLFGLDEDGDGIEDDSVGNGWFIGQPIDVYYRYLAVGIFQEGENIIETHQPNARPGDIRLFDRLPDDGILNAENDRVLTSRVPDWLGTFSYSMDYKNIDFSFDITTVQGVIRDNPFLYGYAQGGSLRGIKNGIRQDYWTPENPGGIFPRPNEANDPVNGNSLGLQDASYVRLQNINLGYTLRPQVSDAIGLNRFRLYVTGSNLITLTDFESYSPEKNPNDYPEAVTIVAGLQLSF